MGPAEIVASLKELCENEGPHLTTERIVAWIEGHKGYDSDADLIQFAKKMKARQFARLLEYEDAESGQTIKRLWSLRDPRLKRRYYADVARLPEARRHRLIRQYTRFLAEMRDVRRAMSDYFAGQQFFAFHAADADDAELAAAEA